MGVSVFKSFREKVNVSQQDLADMLGARRSTLSMDECDIRRSSPSFKILISPLLIAIGEIETSSETSEAFRKQQETMAAETTATLRRHLEGCRVAWQRNQLKMNAMREASAKASQALKYLFGLQDRSAQFNKAQNNFINHRIAIETKRLEANGPLAQKMLEIKIAGQEAEIQRYNKLLDIGMDIMLASKNLLAKSARRPDGI